jgi:1,4-dihydroxy-2-naphthoyl-CoA hydrolase
MQFTTQGTLLEALDICLVVLEKDRVVGKMPVSSKTKQIAGVLHGGASAALVETVASIASCLNINMETHEALGTELNISHLRAISDGNVIGVATPIRIGRTIHVWNVIISKENAPEVLIATGRCSVFIKKK